MELMNMEGVQLARTILDDPVFHRTLLRNDVRGSPNSCRTSWALVRPRSGKIPPRWWDRWDRSAFQKNIDGVPAPVTQLRAIFRWLEEEVAGELCNFDRASGAFAEATIFASVRLGSFSPPGPVSTVLVTSKLFSPSAGPVTINSARAPGGNPICVCGSTESFRESFWFIGTPSMATNPRGCG